jgi:integrase
LKSAESARVIDLPASVSQFLQTERTETPGRFILTGNDKPSRKSRCYRANPTFRFLSAWLKLNGVADRKPIHVLRKEIGSLIASKQGIFAASRYLAHSGIQITGQIYADQKASVIAPISALLAPETP